MVEADCSLVPLAAGSRHLRETGRRAVGLSPFRLTRPGATLSPSDAERDGLRGKLGYRRAFLACALVAAQAMMGQPLARAAEPPDCKIGDIAPADILAPVQLIVIDRAATEALKEREAQKIAAIVRYNTNVSALVLREFLDAVAAARSNFLDGVAQVFPRRQVNTQFVNTPRFRQLVREFQTAYPAFPITTNLARVWAQELPDEALLAPVAEKLQTVLAQPLRADTLPPNLKLGQLVRLVAVADTDPPLALPSAATAGRLTPRTNLLTLNRVRLPFAKDFPPASRPLARAAVAFIRENCIIETVLTQQLRAQRTDPLYAADRYEPGDVIVKRGQVIDAKALAALVQLREKAAIGELQRETATAQSAAQRMSRQNWWLLGSVVALSGTLALLVLWLARRRRAVALVPLRVAEAEKLLLVSDTASLTPMRSDPGSEALRAGFMAQLARLLGSSLVQRLVSQRKDLLETQRLAAAEIAEMEKRLEEVHTPLRERLQAYEGRIADLERQLARKGAENRALLKAKIEVTRRQLESERVRNRVEFN